jgi:polysaccharide pyruvyl transferase WcaK-like protein
MAEVAIARLGSLVGLGRLRMGCARPEMIHATYGIQAFPHYSVTDDARRAMIMRRPHSFLKSSFTTVSQLLQADAVFVCGGGNLTSEWPGVLESRLRFLDAARRLGKPVILVSQTLGPYSSEHQARIDHALAHAAWIGVRDRTFSRTQTAHQVRFAVDDACFLEPRHTAASRAIVESAGAFMALSMRDFGSATPLQLRARASTVSRLAGLEGLSTVFIPHHAPNGTGGDIRLARAIASEFPEERFSLVDPILLASELKAVTSHAQWVVTMRYHQLVFALSLGIPSVGVSVNAYTDAKLRGAFEQLNLDPLVVPLKEAPDELERATIEARRRKDAFIEAAQSFREREREASLAPYELAASLLA